MNGKNHYYHGSIIPGDSYPSLWCLCYIHKTSELDRVGSVFDDNEDYFRVNNPATGYCFYSWVPHEGAFFPVDIDVPVRVLETLDFRNDPQLRSERPTLQECLAVSYPNFREVF